MSLNLQIEYSPIYFTEENEYRALLKTIRPYSEFISMVPISDVKNEFIDYLKENGELLGTSLSDSWGEEDLQGKKYKNHIYRAGREVFDRLNEFDGFFKRVEANGKEKILTTGFGLSNIMFFDDRGLPLFYTILTETMGKIRSDLYPMFEKNRILF